MYLKNIIIENSGPIEKLNIKLPFCENSKPKPIILVGENGKGKSTVLSSVVDALFEFAKQSFDDITDINANGSTPYYKVMSNRNIRIGNKFSFTFLEFEGKEKKVQYIEKLGDLSFALCQERSENKLQLSEGWVDNGPIKKVSQEKAYFEEEFKNSSICFFPPNRHEKPSWMNEKIAYNTKVNIRSKLVGALNKPLIVQDVTNSNLDWLLDIIVDSRADVFQDSQGAWHTEESLNDIKLLKIARENVEEILSEILGKKVKFGLNWRNSADTRFNIIDKNSNQMIIPTLGALSTGELALFNIFSTIIRYSDYGDINKSIKLEEIKGIVVIDEIDLHTHAIIQREILPKLIKNFPGVQFICTSHSPLFILGMQELFGDNGFNLYQMPDGEEINCERFSEFESSYNYFRETNLFKNDIAAILKEAKGKPLIITEGKTDWKHIKSALNSFKEEGEYTDLDINFLEYESEMEMGSSELVKICKSISKLNNENKIICIFDRDVPSDLKQVIEKDKNFKIWNNNVISIALPIPESRKNISEILCIEHYYKDNDIKKEYEGRRLFLGDEFHETTGIDLLEHNTVCTLRSKCGKKYIIDSNVVRIGDENTNIALSKNDFANNIYNRGNGVHTIDIDDFKLLFDLIEQVISV